MDNIIKSIQNKISEKESLLAEAKVLEERARILREKAQNNDFGLEIASIQNEIMRMQEKQELLENLIELAAKSFGTSEETISISLNDYQNCSFNGKSILMMEQELTSVTLELVFLSDLLSQICGYVGHDYRFVKSDEVFDFSGLESGFEERHFYTCAICGKSVILEEKQEGNDEVLSDKNLELLKALRKARKIKGYQSRFKIVDTLNADFGEIRR